jgi:hypothetical protein
VYGVFSMSIRTKPPSRDATLRARPRTRSPHAASSSPRPNAVSLTETFARRRCSSIASSTRAYSAAVARASEMSVMNSPRTSTVASQPASFSARIARTASSTVSPAM